MTILVKYSCVECGTIRASVEVPAREDEDVRVWMDATVRLVGAAHARRSPECHPDTLTELLIPAAGVDRIGGPAIQ